jgi:hypothetical protein
MLVIRRYDAFDPYGGHDFGKAHLIKASAFMRRAALCVSSKFTPRVERQAERRAMRATSHDVARLIVRDGFVD